MDIPQIYIKYSWASDSYDPPLAKYGGLVISQGDLVGTRDRERGRERQTERRERERVKKQRKRDAHTGRKRQTVREVREKEREREIAKGMG